MQVDGECGVDDDDARLNDRRNREMCLDMAAGDGGCGGDAGCIGYILKGDWLGGFCRWDYASHG